MHVKLLQFPKLLVRLGLLRLTPRRKNITSTVLKYRSCAYYIYTYIVQKQISKNRRLLLNLDDALNAATRNLIHCLAPSLTIEAIRPVKKRTSYEHPHGRAPIGGKIPGIPRRHRKGQRNEHVGIRTKDLWIARQM